MVTVLLLIAPSLQLLLASLALLVLDLEIAVWDQEHAKPALFYNRAVDLSRVNLTTTTMFLVSLALVSTDMVSDLVKFAHPALLTTT